MRAFSIEQKWSKMTKMTPDGLLPLEMVLIEPPKNDQNALLVL